MAGVDELQGFPIAYQYTWISDHNPVDLSQPPAPGTTTTLFSPRATTSGLLAWYADQFDAAASSAHITGAFGLHHVFRDRLGIDRDVVRTVAAGPAAQARPADPSHRPRRARLLR